MSIEKTSEDTTQLRTIIGALSAGNNVLLTGPGGCAKCLDPDTPVMKYDGEIIPAYKINPSDVLIGDDSEPRFVLSAEWGYGEKYKVSTSQGDVFLTNKDHILTLKQAYQHVIKEKNGCVTVYFPKDVETIAKAVFETKRQAKFFCKHLLSRQDPLVVDIPIYNYLEKGKMWKHFFLTYKVPVIYPMSPIELKIEDPYLLGLQLNSEITGNEPSYAAYTYMFGVISVSRFSLFELKELAKITGANRIPTFLFTTSLYFRKRLLAGICDELALYDEDERVLVIKLKQEPYIRDIERLARSIGLSAYIQKPPITKKKYELIIYGREFWNTMIDSTNTHVSLKFGSVRLKRVALLHTTVQYHGIGYYYGFQITDNGRFLLGNHCVTHNTHTLKAIATHFHLSGAMIACTATTGVAALGLSIPEVNLSPQTFHSWAGIGLGDRTAKAHAKSIMSNVVLVDRWRTIKYLIIDEISMMGAELLDKINEVAMIVRKNPSPFGGITLILSGDFLQLPPVKDEFAFGAKCWESLQLTPFIFKEPKRYDDLAYFELLLRVRQGTHTEADVRKLYARTVAYKKLMECLEEGKNLTAIKPTIMYCTRACVNHYNVSELNKLTSPSQTYTAFDEFKPSGNIKKEEYYKTLLEDTIPSCITLKIGAQVMLKANLNLKAGLVNGSRGVVEGLSAYAVTVRFVNGARVVVVPQAYTVKEDKYQATRIQIPLILAWALTIHKSQGVTLDYTICDIGSSVFAPGQAYVALSRVRNLKGLFLSGFNKSALYANTKAVRYNKLLEGGGFSPQHPFVKIMEEHLRKAQTDTNGKTLLSENHWKYWLVDNKHLPFKDWKDVLDMGKKTGYDVMSPAELFVVVNAKLGLAERNVFEKVDWKKWLLNNHVDKGGDLEECKLVIGYGSVMEWTQ